MTISEIKDVLADGPARNRADCDRCQQDHIAVYPLPESVDGQLDGADWCWCAPCLRYILSCKESARAAGGAR